jgi:molecular chaperone IbpA
MTQTYTTGSGSTTSFTFPRASFVGFERMFDELSRVSTTNNYPPHNVVQLDEDNYLIEIAVAGFKKEDLEIQLKDSILTVEGKKEDTRTYSHKGISSREFTRTFTLGEYVQVNGASLEDGILAIQLQRVVPEEERPRKIDISGKTEKKKTFLKD